MRKVVVTGANGFIGSSLIKKLITENVEVIAVDISFADLHIPESELITRVEVSLDSVDVLGEVIPMDRYDAFYHFAWNGVNGKNKANPNVQIKNIDMVINCALIAKKIGCTRFLCAGTIAESVVKSLENLTTTNSGMLYGVSKYCAYLLLETLCKNIDLEFVWMQFSNIYGPDNKTGNLISYTLEQLRHNLPATFGPALQMYDFIFVDDLIDAVYRLGDSKCSKNKYYIGSGTPRILKEYLLEIGKYLDKEELIQIGIRQDDGVVYTEDMFDVSDLKADVGEYISRTFTEGIRFTINNY